MPMNTRFPEWIRRPWGSGEDFSFTKGLLGELRLHTVCQSANCPNQGECWAHRTATVMILGGTCTRSCRFCSVHAGVPDPVDPEEPQRVAEAVRAMDLLHTVVTAVTRDDLPDGGAEQFVRTLEAIRACCPQTTIEVLTSDFAGDAAAIDRVMDAGPEVFGHNIETVERLQSQVRDRRSAYSRSLDALRMARRLSGGTVIKSAMMLGHGETPDEVRQTLVDLYEAGVEAVAIGQYLRPGKRQREVVEFIRPEQFAEYEELARNIGMKYAIAGPFVRSSYRSDELMKQEFVRERLSSIRRGVRYAI